MDGSDDSDIEWDSDEEGRGTGDIDGAGFFSDADEDDGRWDSQVLQVPRPQEAMGVGGDGQDSGTAALLEMYQAQFEDDGEIDAVPSAQNNNR